MNVAEITNLRVDYDEVVAVQGVSFNLEAGKIYGFVGPNGAGKTSTIKAMAGIIEPKLGQIVLDGFNLETQRDKALSHVGYMPDFPPVYERLKVWEYLDVFAAAYGLNERERPAHVRKWIDRVNLNVKSDALIKGLSRGMRQRLVLAKILETNPKILLLDEPASGLDPIARMQMRDLLKQARDEGATILISSHILSELADFVDSVIILEKGKLIVAGSIAEIRERLGGVYRVIVQFEDDIRGSEILTQVAHQRNIDPGRITRDRSRHIVDFGSSQHDATQFLGQLIANGAVLTECMIKSQDIEEIFLKLGAKEVA